MLPRRHSQPNSRPALAWNEVESIRVQVQACAAKFGDESNEDGESVGNASDDSEAKDQIEWDEAPGISGAIARLVQDHYYVMFNVFMIVVHILAAIVFFLPPDGRCVDNGGMGQMQVCTQSEHDWELSFLDASKRKDAIGFARGEASDSFSSLSTAFLGSGYTAEHPRSMASDTMNLRFLFWHEDEEANEDTDIFTPKKVQSMCELESVLTAHPFYPSLCILNANGSCAPQPFSIAARFYAPNKLDPATGGCPELNASTVALVTAELAAEFTTATAFFASIDTVTGGYTNRTRSLLQLGAPLEGFRDADDADAEQREIYLAVFRDTKCGGFGDAEACAADAVCSAVKAMCIAAGIQDGKVVDGVETELWKRYRMRGVPRSGPYQGAFVSPYDHAEPEEGYENEADMAVRFWSAALQQEEFGRVVNGDLNFAILSVLLVGAYIWFHTQSLMIAALSMFQITISLPVGFFFYYNVFQIRYYASVNILAIYLALGIGADSVFVFSDAWNQTRANPAIRTVLGRLSYSIHRTVTSCFNTTVTTVMSLVATSLTPVVPIYCFAAFASCVLAVNYLFVCLFTPVVVMLHHLLFSDVGGVCVCCDKRAGQVTKQCAPKEAFVKPDLVELRGKDVFYSKYSQLASDYWFPTPDPLEMRAEEEACGELGKLSRSERCFHRYVYGLLAISIRGVTAGAWVCVVLTSGYAALMAAQAFRLTPPTAQEEWFPSSHMFNGELSARLFDNWQGSADNGYLSMAFVLGVETADRSKHNRLFPNHNRGAVVFDDDFDLSSEASQRFFLSLCDRLEGAPCTAAACQPSGFLVLRGGPVTCVVRDLLQYYQASNGSHANATVVPEGAFNEVVIDFFSDTKNGSVSVDELVRRQREYQAVIGLDASESFRVQWAAVTFQSSASLPMTNSEARELRDAYQAVVDEMATSAPVGMKSLFQTDTESAGSGWTWLDVENALISNLLRGFVICFPVVFVVLVLATGNVVIALFATTSIAFIVAGVLGAAKLYHGWDLGIAESIAGVIVIGFSVDYTVHLGHVFVECDGSRRDKTQHALTQMGTTVIGGGLTTLSAGLVLLLCTLTFFTKMALLLLWTVALSVLYALLFFMPLCLLFGPEGGFAQTPTLFHALSWVSAAAAVAFRRASDFVSRARSASDAES